MNKKFVPDADELTKKCFDAFDSLPKSGKPVIGVEWTVLSCIAKYHHQTNDTKIVALGTGTKCLGKSSLNMNGDTLHDSHAEIMCRRGFLRYLYEEMKQSISGEQSIFAFDDARRKFEISESISFHFITTYSPCGDASIYTIDEMIENKRKKLDSPHDDKSIGLSVSAQNFTGAKILQKQTDVVQDLMIQTVGEIRTKPGRGEPTLSISCSDKLAKWNVMGIQGALIQSLISKPIYLSSVTLCDPIYCNIEATERAIWKRFESKCPIASTLFEVNHPKVQISEEKQFKYSKSMELEPAPGSIVAWHRFNKYSHQVAVNGIRLGVTKKNANKPSGRLSVSKIELFRCYLDILKKYNNNLKLYANDTDFQSLSYNDAKKNASEYQQLWKELKQSYFCIWTRKSNELNLFKIDQYIKLFSLCQFYYTNNHFDFFFHLGIKQCSMKSLFSSK